MGSAGLEFDPADSYSAARLNQKTTFVGTGAQISGLSTTYAGMKAYCTSTGSGFSIDTLYVRNAANNTWTNVNFTESAEQNSTPVTDGADFTATAGTKYFAFYTLPTTEKLYLITGIEIKNGATVNGNIQCGVSVVDANPPTLAGTSLVAHAMEEAQAGASAVQRFSLIASKPIRGGTILGIWVQCSSGTATLREETGLGSQNQQKASAYDASPDTNDSTAWATATARKYLKLYFRGYN